MTLVKKNYVLVVLALAFIITLSVFSAGFPSEHTAYADAPFLGGGFELNPYIINSEQDLAQLSNYVNTDSASPYASAFYKLGGNIVISGDIFITPIGLNGTFAFKGNFDGDGKSISGVEMSTLFTPNGVFGYTSGATIKNLSVQGQFQSATNMGGIIGYAHNTAMINCSAEVTLTSNTQPTATNLGVGGLIGYSASSSVTNCSAEVTLTSNNTSSSVGAGGLIGYMASSSATVYSTITNSYATGAVNGNTNVGGLAGYSQARNRIINSFNATTLNGVTNVGGIAGYVAGVSNPRGQYNNIYNKGDINISGNASNVGGIMGFGQFVDILHTYNSGNINYQGAGTLSAIGGIIGNTSGTGNLQNSYSFGEMLDIPTNTAQVGGLVGIRTANFTLSNSYYATDKVNSGTFGTGGSDTGTVYARTSSMMVGTDALTNGAKMSALGDAQWIAEDNVAGVCYPQLKVFNQATVDTFTNHTIVKQHSLNSVLVASFVVTFIYEDNYWGGATGNNSEITRVIADGGNYGELPTPYRTGSILSGWYKMVDGDKINVTESDIPATADDAVLYADWIHNTNLNISISGGKYIVKNDDGDLTGLLTGYDSIQTIFSTLPKGLLDDTYYIHHENINVIDQTIELNGNYIFTGIINVNTPLDNLISVRGRLTTSATIFMNYTGVSNATVIKGITGAHVIVSGGSVSSNVLNSVTAISGSVSALEITGGTISSGTAINLANTNITIKPENAAISIEGSAKGIVISNGNINNIASTYTTTIKAQGNVIDSAGTTTITLNADINCSTTTAIAAIKLNGGVLNFKSGGITLIYGNASGNSNFISADNDSNINIDSGISFSVPVKEGLSVSAIRDTFDNYVSGVIGDNMLTSNASYNVIASDNYTLFAVYRYAVSLNTGIAATLGDLNVIPNTTVSESEIDYTNIIKAGYHRNGWYYMDGDEEIDFVFNSTLVNGNMTLILRWAFDNPVVSVGGYANPVTYGNVITLTAIITHGAADLYTYEWYKVGSGTILSTSSTLEIRNVADSGTYRVEVVVSYGSDSSSGNATKAVVINKKTIAVSADSGQNKIYGESDPLFTYSFNSADLYFGDTFSGDLSRDVGVNVGQYDITKGSLAINDNYTINFDGAPFTITKKALADGMANFTDLISIYYTGNPITRDITLTDGNPNILSANDVTFNYHNNINAHDGAYVLITAKEDGNYSGEVRLDFVILPLTVVVRPDLNQQKIYGDNDPVLTYTSTPSIPSSHFSGSLTRAVGVDNGTYSINPGTLVLSSNYVMEFDYSVFFTITKRALNADMITFDPYSFEYDKTDKIPTFIVGVPQPMVITADDYLFNYSNNINAGTTAALTITAVENSNYTGSATAYFTIGKKNVVVNATEGQFKIYGQADPTFLYTYNPSDLVQGDNFTGKLGRATGSNAGFYAIERGTLNLGINYNIIFNSQDFEIRKKAITSNMVSAITGSFSYTGGLITPVVNVSDGSISIVLDSDYKIEYYNNLNKGQATVVITALPNGNYTGTLTRYFTINAKTLIVNWDVVDYIYNGEMYAPTASVDTGIDGESVELIISGGGQILAGVYEASAVMSEANDNYVLSNAILQYEILKRVIEYQWSQEREFIYNGSLFSVTAEITNKVGGDDVTLLFTDNSNINAGAYIAYITALSGDDMANYELPQGIIATTYDIFKADAYIYAESEQTAIYSGNNINAIAELSHIEGNLIFSSDNGYVSANEEGYIITISALETDNYNAPDSVEVTLYIMRAVVDISSISFNDTTYVYNGQAQSLTISGNIPYGVNVPLYYNNTATNVNDGILSQATLNCDSNHKFDINGNDIYTITLSAILTIAPKPITVEYSNTTHIYDGTQKDLTATLIGVYESIDFTITYLSPEERINAGAYIARVSLNSLETNYYLSGNIDGMLKVNKAEAVITVEDLVAVYDKTPKSISGAVANSGGYITYSDNNSRTDAGTTIVTVTSLETYNHYAATVEVRIIILKAPSVITTGPLEITETYDGSVRTVSAEIDNDEQVIIFSQGPEFINAGIYNITISADESENYLAPEAVIVNLTILKATSIITTTETELTYTYNGNKRTVTAEIDNDEQVLIFTPASEFINAGIYNITITADESENYLAPAAVNVKLTILANTISSAADDVGYVRVQINLDSVNPLAVLLLSSNMEKATLRQYNQFVPSEKEVFEVVNLSLTLDNVEITPTGMIEVRLNIPREYRFNKQLSVISLDDNGNAVEYSTVRDNDTLIFMTNDINGTFMIVGEKSSSMNAILIIAAILALVYIVANKDKLLKRKGGSKSKSQKTDAYIRKVMQEKK